MKRINICIIIVLSFLLFPLQLVLSQEMTDIELTIREKIENSLDPNQTPSKTVNITDDQLKTVNPQRLLEFLMSYDKNQSFFTRRLALLYEVRLANSHPTTQIRQEVTKRLVEGLIEKKSSISNNCYEWLLTFKKDDFNKNSKEILRTAIATKNSSSRILLIIGIADIKEILPRLQELAIDEKNDRPDPTRKWYYKINWAARLAMARMGIKEEITKCIEMAESEQDSDERVKRVLPKIGYIRQPEAIEYLKKYLESSKRLPDIDNRPGPTYASRVVHILAESLENFPIKQKDARDYKEEEIALCRKWMSEQKEWKIIR